MQGDTEGSAPESWRIQFELQKEKAVLEELSDDDEENKEQADQ